MTARADETIRVYARAKINLYLHVLNRREDGYHELDSLFVFGDLADVIAVTPARSLSLEIRGPFAGKLSAKDENSVLRAARLLADAVQIRPQTKITLTKNLPIAAGLGGGSADAAAVLRALAELWRISPSAVDLTLLGLGIGSDVPACLLSEPCYVGGIGEQIEPIPALPALPLLLVNPGVELATSSVFRTFGTKFSETARFPEVPTTIPNLISLLQTRHNDLQRPAIEQCSGIAEILHVINETEGCLLARLSGSGATCFGIYENIVEAKQAAASLKKRGWWAEATMTAKAERPWEDF